MDFSKLFRFGSDRTASSTPASLPPGISQPSTPQPSTSQPTASNHALPTSGNPASRSASRVRNAVIPGAGGAGGTTSALQPARVDPAVIQAMAQAGLAHEQVPRRMDVQADATAVMTASRLAMQDVVQRARAADRQAGTALTEREQAVATARAGVDAARATRDQRRSVLAGLQQQLDQATLLTPVLRADMETARDLPALAAARQALREAELARTQARLAVATAPPTPPSSSAAMPSPRERLRQAEERVTQATRALAPFEQRLTDAERALSDNGRAIERHRGDVQAAAGALSRAESALGEAEATLRTAETAVAALTNARQRLAEAVPRQSQAMQAHGDAAQAAIDAAGQAVQAHRTLATLTAAAAEATRDAQGARDAVLARRELLRQAEVAHQQESGLLAPDAPLQRRLADCTAAVASAQAEVAAQARGAGSGAAQGGQGGAQGARGAQGPLAGRRGPFGMRRTAAATPGPDERLQSANAALQSARDAIDAQQRRVAAALQVATDVRSALPALEAEEARTAALSSRAEAARGHQYTVAAQDDAAVAATRASRDALGGAAERAVRSLQESVIALCHEISPEPIAAARPERSAKERLGDGLRGAWQSLETVTGPARFDASLGPLSLSSSSASPTTFHNGRVPQRTPTTAIDSAGLKSVDRKTHVAASNAANLLAGGKGDAKGPAQTPAAFGTAVAFTSEVDRLFAAPAAPAAAGVAASPALEATPAATRLAQALLDHPNPDPVGRPDGHPLRHEQALLIASVLRAVTHEPAQAAQVYHRLWHEPAPAVGGVSRRAAGSPSPLDGFVADQAAAATATGATGAAATTAAAPADVQRMANEARRALASTTGGMQALLSLQGLSLPATTDADALRHAAQSIEHYKLALRAEDALLKLGMPVGGTQSTEDVRRAIAQHPQAAKLVDATRLGTGNARRVPGGPRDAEHPATLASQAFLFATANQARVAGAAELEADKKPAYVALRNGFTESGQGSGFNLMTKRLHKLVKYIDLACQSPVGTTRGMLERLGDPIGGLRRAIGKDKTPLKTLMQAGPLGSTLSTVPGEHRKLLGEALGKGDRLLKHDLQSRVATLDPAARAGGLMRLATLQLWQEKLAAQPASADPSAGVTLRAADIRTRAQALAIEVGAPADAWQGAVADVAARVHASLPLRHETLKDWFRDKRLADPGAAPSTDPDMASMHRSLETLAGKARFDDTLKALQDEFDRGAVDDRRRILKQVLTSVVAGGDMTDYSDGRKNGIGGMFGYGVASFEGLGGMTTGVTPVGEFNLDHTRTAVLRAGVASNTGVIYLGNETKVSEMIGGGVRVGAEAGPVFNLTGQAMARLGGAHLFSRGLMIRTNKQGKEYEQLSDAQKDGLTTATWKRMSELVVKSVFEIADQPAAARPVNGGQMWAQMVDKVGDFRDISFGWNEASAHSANVSASVDGIVSAKLGAGFKASATAGAGIKQTFFNRGRSRDTGGAMQAVQGSSGTRTSVGGGASVGVAHPTLKSPDNPDIGLFARHKVGVETELVIRSKNGLVRITTEDGRVRPEISYKHREVGRQDHFIELVNSQRPIWEARLGEHGPDGTLQGGDRMLQSFLQQLVDLPPGNHRTYIERKCLTPEAAATINACMERLAVLNRPPLPGAAVDPGAAAQAKALQRQIVAQVEEESSWQPFRLFVNEMNQAVKESGSATEVRATPASVDDTAAGPTGFAERFLGGGKVTLGGKVNSAHGGRDLLTLDALPVRAPTA